MQIVFCVRAFGGLLSDFRADCVLRYCLLWSIIGPSCSRRAALWSLFACFETLVQYGARADCALAYETRVGSPLDFQPERVSAPSFLRARNAALRQVVASRGCGQS